MKLLQSQMDCVVQNVFVYLKDTINVIFKGIKFLRCIYYISEDKTILFLCIKLVTYLVLLKHWLGDIIGAPAQEL